VPPRARRSLRERDYQDPREPVRMLAQANERHLAKDLREAFRHLRNRVPVAEIARLIRHGHLAGVADAAGLGHFGEVLKEPFQRLGEVWNKAADIGADRINRDFKRAGKRVRYRPRVAKAIGDGFDFDLLDEETQAALREAQDDLIAQLDSAARDVIEAAITNGVNAGDTPEEIAAAIRDTISLTDRQAQAVTNYRLLLEDLDSGALNRALRNIEYDAAVEDAIDSGEFLSADAIDRMVEDYADNFLDFRADTIARTESLRAANQGLRDGYRQAADRGVFPAEAVTRHWQIATDERVCPVCQSVAERNPDGVGLDEDFESEDGPQDDPPIHPRCRCTVEYITNLDMLPDDETEDEDQAAA